MAHSLKVAIAVLVTVLAVFPTVQLVREMQLGVFLATNEAATIGAFELDPGPIRTLAARSTLERVNAEFLRTGSSADLHLLAAANYRLLKRADLAEREYIRALESVRQPSIYLQLGHVQVELGKMESAYRNYAIAVRFSTDFARELGPHASVVVRRLDELEPLGD